MIRKHRTQEEHRELFHLVLILGSIVALGIALLFLFGGPDRIKYPDAGSATNKHIVFHSQRI